MMAEYESGSVTESCRESVDDIVSGEDLGGDEFSVCFIFRVDSGLAANELVTAIKDGSFDKKKKLVVVIRHVVDQIGLQKHCPGIERLRMNK